MATTNQNITKIIDLKIKGAEAIGMLEKLTQELEREKETIKKLNDEKKANGKLSKEDFDAQQLAIATSKQLQKEINQQSNVLKNNAAESRAATGSLKELRAQYNTLKVTYEELSEAQREALIPQMKEIKDKIEEADKAVGNYSTSVGNYEGAIKNALPGFGKFQQVIQGLGIDANATARVMAQNVVTSLKAVGSSMRALMANPLIAGIAGILAVILAIREAINKNQEAMDALQRIFAPFKVIVDAFFRGLGDLIAGIVTGISKFLEFITPVNGALNEAIKAQKTLQQLREAEIADIEETAAGNRRIAELQDIIAAKDKFTHEQRMNAAKEIKKEIDIQARGETERANLRLKAFEQENSIALKNKTLTADERREYAELKSAIDKVAQANIARGKEATAVIAETAAAIKAEKLAVENAEKAKRKEYSDTAKRRMELQNSLNQQLEDLANSLISSEQAREIAEAETKNERNKELVEKQLMEGQDLTIKARNDLKAILLLIEEREKIEISAINKKYSDAEIQRQIEARDIEFQEKETFKAAQKAYEDQRILDEEALNLEKLRQQLGNEFELEKQLAQEESDFLKNLDEKTKDEMYLTQEAYELAVLKSNERIAWANSDLRRSEIEKAQQLLAGVGSIAGSMSALFGEIAGKSKTMQGFQKALGLVQIASDMAVGIAGAIKAGAGIPFPGNIPAIATGVTAVIAGITSAISTLKGSGDVQIPQELKSSSGSGSSGSVSAPSIPALPAPTYTTTTLNLGGSDTANQGSQSNAAAEMKAAIKEAYADIPAPVVKVSDIQSATAGAENIKNIAVI